MTALKAHSGIHPLKKNFHLLAALPAEQAFPPGIQTDLTVTSCFQMRHGVMTGCNHPRNIPGRRRRQRVDVEDARRNRRF